MGDEPRFPPPRGEEPIGYREAGAAASDGEQPDLPVPSSSSFVFKRKRVVASRPDDPDIALAKAFTPPRTKPQQVSFVGIAILIIVVIVYIGLEVAQQVRKPSRRVPPTVNAVQ
jgi:hypothetical protein